MPLEEKQRIERIERTSHYSQELDLQQQRDSGSSSKQFQPSSQQENEVNEKLIKFVEYFVTIYERSLSEYYERLENRIAKPGKVAEFFNKFTEIAKGGTEGIEAEDIKAYSIVGINVFQHIISSFGAKYNREELKKLVKTHQLYIFKDDPLKVREELVKSGIDIFHSFESQFVQVTADECWQRALTKLAEDAVARIINYCKKNTEEDFSACSITKGVLLGESKRYTHTSISTPHLKTGHTLQNDKAQSWNTATLFNKAGVVTIKRNGTADKYYKRRDGKSKTSEYGYRLLFKWETEDRVKLLHIEYQEEKPPREEYTYILKPYENVKAELVTELLDKINNQDPTLMEDRLVNVIEGIKQDAMDNADILEALISSNFDNLLNDIKEYQYEIKKVITAKLKEIAADNKNEHKTTQALVENSNEALIKLQKGQKDIQNKIRILLKDVLNKIPIWFDVNNPVTFFTALSVSGKGRLDTLARVACEIQKGIVVISGLDGVGKSELAIKYAHDHSKDYEGNVIWINAETQETLKKSFYRLAKEKLNITIEDEDEECIKSIIENVYEYFANGKSLFIFDNAEKYASVHNFLPLTLSPNSNKPSVLITSPNNLEWKESDRSHIEVLLLDDFTDEEAIEFVKKFLEIADDSQERDQDVTELVKTLHNFPLALRQAVVYIKVTNEELKKRNLNFKVRDYLKMYEETPKDLLNVKVKTLIHTESICRTLEITLGKLKMEEFGQKSLNMLNIISYFASSNIPEEMFLNELANGNRDTLKSITRQLEKYAIVRFEGALLSVHGLVQKVMRLNLAEQKGEEIVLEEKTLANALILLKEHMINRKSVEQYAPHVTSAWNYAIRYDELIKIFIVNDNKAAYTTYFHLIAEGSTYTVVEAIINKVETFCCNTIRRVINTKDEDRGMPIHNAALSGDARIVKLLIEKGASVNVRKKHSWTPLHLAANNGYLEVVNVLLDNKANVSYKTGYKFTSLHLAARNGYPEVVKLLLGNRADVNGEDRHKYTPLHFAAKNNHFGVVQALLEYDEINVNAKTKFNLTPLHFAARAGYIKTVNVLLKKGANVNIKDTGCFTPLHLAAINDHIEVVNDLLTINEIDVNPSTTKGNTPLHLAAEKGNLEVVKALIARNANVDVKNEEGKLASDLAHEKNHFEVENYIIQNQDEELSSQIEQPKFNKRQGTSGISGQLYEIELSMLFLLQGVTRKEDNKINSFYLATNMKEAGDFDDVVFKYKYNENGAEKSKIVFLQAKHKETEKTEKETKGKEKKITIDTLLSKSEKGDFILRKYLSSYRKISQLRLKSDHTLFKDSIESCDFVIYTNAVFNFYKSKESAEEHIEKKYIEPGDILNLKQSSDERDWYYKINACEKVMDALRYSLDFEILIKELASSFSSGSIDGNKPIFKEYQVSLAEKVIEKINQTEGKLKDDFLDGEFSKALFEEMKKKKEFAEKSVSEWKVALKNKKIQLINNFGSAEGNDFKLPLPRKLFSDEEIKEFLNELKLFVNQLNERKLGEMIKDKIQKIYKVEEQDIDSVFSEVEYRVRKWWKEGNEYLTELNTFYQESARVSIKFDVKAPVILFTGRIRQLEDLHKILQDGREAVISQMASVTGLGGIGKSELARKYISTHNKDYDYNIIWINADNYLTTADSFRRLAKDELRMSATDEIGKDKEITLIVKEVYRFFAKRHRKSLFVFDNAGKYKTVKEGDEGIDKFLPSGPNKPSVLITSRDQDWGSSIAQLQLDVFTDEEAVEFIRKSFVIDDAYQENEIRSLAKELQYLPLALQQAVAYINNENLKLSKWRDEKFTVSNYLELYKEKAEELLNKTGDTYDRYTKTVITTWEITIDKITKRKVRGGIEALEILDIIAYLAPDKIPIDGIFLNLIDNEEVLHSAVELLDQYSMANLDQGILNIHRLVQYVTRIKLVGQNKEENVLRKALAILIKPVKERESPTGSKYTSHAVSAWDYASKHDEVVKEFSKLPSLIVKKMDDSVRYEEACLFGKSVSELLKRILGPGHEDTLAAMHSMAEVLYNQGKYEEALLISYEVYEKRKETLGHNHSDTLTMQSDIASVLSKQGKYNEALKAYTEVFEKRKHVLGLDHPDILQIKHNIARALNEQGKYDEALQVYTEVYDIANRTTDLGPDHETTLKTRNSIAETLVNLGKCNEALQIYNEVYDKIKDILGPHHPTSLSTRNNMAVVFCKQAKYTEALQAFNEVYEIQKREDILGSDHPNTLRTQSNIAAVLDMQGNYEVALQVYNEMYNKQVNKLCSDHPSTLTILNNIALILYNMNKYEQSFQMYEEVFEKSKEVLGLGHPTTLISLNGMASVLSNQGKQDEALKSYERVYELQKEKFGPDHPNTLTVWSNMAKVLYEEGKYDEALQIFNKVYTKRNDILGPNHPDTSSARDFVKNCTLYIVVAKEANLNDVSGRIPLLHAAESGHIGEVKLLIKKCADINVKDKYGRTSLHLATLGGHQEIVQLLLGNHANVSIKDEDKKTPLDLAQEKLMQDPQNENFKTITGFLLSVTDDFKCQEEQVASSMPLQECLPGPSSRN